MPLVHSVLRNDIRRSIQVERNSLQSKSPCTTKFTVKMFLITAENDMQFVKWRHKYCIRSVASQKVLAEEGESSVGCSRAIFTKIRFSAMSEEM
jgi:hypothetical protein